MDPVLRVSSRIAAASPCVRPTDIRTWPETAGRDQGHSRSEAAAVVPGREAAGVSPLVCRSPTSAPAVLLVHGDKDALVPIDTGKQMIEALKKAKVPSEFLIIEGAGHGFSAENNKRIVPALVTWFEQHLARRNHDVRCRCLPRSTCATTRRVSPVPSDWRVVEWLAVYRHPLDPAFVEHAARYHGGIPGRAYFDTTSEATERIGRFLTIVQDGFAAAPPFQPSWQFSGPRRPD